MSQPSLQWSKKAGSVIVTMMLLFSVIQPTSAIQAQTPIAGSLPAGQTPVAGDLSAGQTPIAGGLVDGSKLLILNGSPSFSNIYISTNSFDPTLGQSVNIHFQLGANANTTLTVFRKSDGVVVRDLTKQYIQPLMANAYDFTWDGKNDNAQYVSADIYTFLIHAVNPGNSTDYVDYTGPNITVGGAQPPAGAPTITNLVASPNNFDGDTQKTAITFFLNTTADVSVSIMDGNQSVFLIASINSLASGNKTFYWDGRTYNNAMVTPKTYSVLISAKNAVVNTPVTASTPVTVYYSSQNPGDQTPIITGLTATPTSINPGNNETTAVNFSLDRAGKVQLKVYDQGGNMVRKFYTDSSLLGVAANQSTSITWNGRNDNNNNVTQGTYKLEVTSYSLITPVTSDVKSAYVTVFYTNGNTNPHISSFSVSPSSFNPSNNESTTTSFMVDKSAVMTFKVYDQNNNLVRTIYDQYNPYSVNGNQNYTIVWNGRNDNNVVVSSGSYKVELGVGPTVNNITEYKTAFVTVNSYNNNQGAHFTSYSVNPYTINPSNGDTVSVYFVVDQSTNVMFKVYDQNNNLVRSFYNENNPYSASANSSYTLQWNGRNDSNNIVGVGTYRLQLSAGTSNPSDVRNSYITVNSSNNPDNGYPTISSLYADPGSFNPNNQQDSIRFNLSNAGYVTVEILGNNNYNCSNNNNYNCSNNFYNDSVIRTLMSDVYESSGNNVVTWNGMDKYGQVVADGYYTARVKARNYNSTFSDVKTTSVQVNRNGGGYTNGDIIRNLTVSPDNFNPTRQNSYLYYNLAKTATVTVEVLNQNGDAVRTLVNNVTRYQTTNSNYNINNYYTYGYNDSWNGRDRYGNMVPDGVYRYRISAYSADANQSETETAYVEVNTDGYINGFPDGKTCGFKDVSSWSPYCKAVEAMKTLGVFGGYADGTFRPYQQITRAEAMKVVIIALSLPLLNYNNGYYANFADTISNSWYMPYIQTAMSMNIISGYPDGTFRPNQTINRVELGKIFMEAARVNVPYCNVAPYSDTPVNTDTRWYIDYVCALKNNNWMHDDGRGYFNPGSPMTRGDVADLFYQYEGNGGHKPLPMQPLTGGGYNPAPAPVYPAY